MTTGKRHHNPRNPFDRGPNDDWTVEETEPTTGAPPEVGSVPYQWLFNIVVGIPIIVLGTITLLGLPALVIYLVLT